MSNQLQHAPRYPGGPCSRCGIVYSAKTAYVPCFIQGDTFETWAARQSEEVLALVPPLYSRLFGPCDCCGRRFLSKAEEDQHYRTEHQDA